MNASHKHSYRPYVFLFSIIFLLMSLPKNSIEKIRGWPIAFLAPIVENIDGMYALIASSFGSQSSQNQESQSNDAESKHKKSEGLSPLEEVRRLKLENQLLRIELTHLQELLDREQHTLSKQLEQLANQNMLPIVLTELLKHRYDELQQLIAMHIQSIPARVIFRSYASWTSSLWLNVGKADNDRLGYVVVAKNSPVLLGSAVVGMIDFVGTHQSRVRLITDSGLNPSVRAVRGDLQNQILLGHIDTLLENVTKQTDWNISSVKQQSYMASLNELKKIVINKSPEGSWFLAKGELRGSSMPRWRTHGHVLRGVGFNYDFADNHGPARDLRTGKPINGSANDVVVPILKVHDILVTTGMDGVFPAGLPVAEVIKVNLLKEGDYFYELEAIPLAGNLDKLSMVFVMPPLGYDPEEKPSFLNQ